MTANVGCVVRLDDRATAAVLASRRASDARPWGTSILWGSGGRTPNAIPFGQKIPFLIAI